MLNFNNSASSQFIGDSLLKSNIDSLLNSGVDTVIAFVNCTAGGVPLINESDIDTRRGVLLDSNYILYFRGSQWTIIKNFTFYQSHSNTNYVLKSTLNVLQDTSLYSLRNNLQSISNDQFLPYVFEVEQNGIKAYFTEYANHLPTYTIIISAKDYFDSKFIEEYTLEEKFPTIGSLQRSVPNNLNYKYNTSLPLFQFFKRLMKYLEGKDSNLKLRD